MGFTIKQREELKEISKEIVKEFMSDKNFLEFFTEKITHILMQKVTDKLNVVENNISTLKEQVILHQAENEEMKLKIDKIEQQSKLNQLRIYGISETKSCDLNETIKQTFENIVEMNDIKIECSYRIGTFDKNRNNKQPRPIIVQFSQREDRNKVFNNKKKLKGTSVVIVEELTKLRYELFQIAKEKAGKNNVWTREGMVYISHNGRKVQLCSAEDFMKIDFK